MVITREHCEAGSIPGVDPAWWAICHELVTVREKTEDAQTHLYITAGVIGGAVLILFILVIALFVKLNNSFRELSEKDALRKRGFSTYTGRPPPIVPNATFAQPPPPFSPAVTKQLTFDNATAGGVRVLPRNPPILRNGNTNEAYY